MKKSMLENMVWRGNIAKEELPFNEVDYLILSVLIYQRFEDVKSYGEGLTIKELYPIVCPLPLSEVKGFDINRYKLWALCASSIRFSTLRLDHFSMSISSQKDNEEQFAAAIFSFDDKNAIVIFRGTDESITGWKEDLNLGFEDEIPSEKKALEFVLEHEKEYSSLTLAGHSKGGTLALYTARIADDLIFNKIAAIWSFDAPGLPDSLATGPRWEKIKEETKSFIPTSSIIGMLFNTTLNPYIVKSDSLGILQHDAFNWNIDKESFILSHDRSAYSKYRTKTMQNFFNNSSKEDREILVEVLYKVLLSVKENNVFKLPIAIVEHFSLFNKALESLNEKEQDVLKRLNAAMREARLSSIGSIVGKN